MITRGQSFAAHLCGYRCGGRTNEGGQRRIKRSIFESNLLFPKVLTAIHRHRHTGVGLLGGRRVEPIAWELHPAEANSDYGTGQIDCFDPLHHFNGCFAASMAQPVSVRPRSLEAA
jgi:hypothetical protein